MNTFKSLLKLDIQFFSADNSMSFTTQDGTQLTPAEWKGFQQYKKEAETKANRPYIGSGVHGGAGGAKTAGEIFVKSNAYKNFIANGQKASDNVSIPAFPTKALVTSTGADGALLSSVPIIGAGQPPMTLRNLLAVQSTTNNAVDYTRETGFTNAAAIAPEGTLKAESALTFESITALVKVIAHWLPVTRQVIADIPSMQAHIDMRLMYGLSVAEESQILYGSGVGDNLEGLMVADGVQEYTPLAEDTYIDTIRKAMSRTYISGFPPTGVVLNPLDWETIELSKGTDGHYIFASVNDGGETRLFRVPVVLSTSMAQGSFLVGAFGLGAQLFDREQANVRISEHHADYFTRNMLAVLCEERLALALYRPEAFVRGTFEPTA